MVLTGEIAAQVLSGQPRVRQALEDVHRHARLAVDPVLLQLVEQRICQLLGTPNSDIPNSAIPDPSEFAGSALGMAALAFVEQWVIDVAGISDEMVSALADHLGQDALMDFVHGVLVIEQRVRLGLAWQQLGLAS